MCLIVHVSSSSFCIWRWEHSLHDYGAIMSAGGICRGILDLCDCMYWIAWGYYYYSINVACRLGLWRRRAIGLHQTALDAVLAALPASAALLTMVSDVKPFCVLHILN